MSAKTDPFVHLPIIMTDERDVKELIVAKDKIDVILVNSKKNTCILMIRGMKFRIPLPASEVNALVFGETKAKAKRKTSAK